MNENPKPEILNPRYQGSTPEDMGRALLRPVEASKETETRQVNGKSEFQSSM